MSSPKTETATFAAGCFWGVESIFRQIDGVISTRVGYTGGDTANPTYQQVCTDKTGHAEAIEIIFDPAKVSYQELLRIFWDNHDPTTLNQQGPDIGTQYRSSIFYHNRQQAEIAKQSKQDLANSQRLKNPIVTEITPAVVFYPAEEYHQNYCEKQGITHCVIREK